MSIIREITLDISKQSEFVKFNIPQGDNIDRKFYVNFIDGADDYIIPSTATVRFGMTKNNGNVIYNICPVSNNKAELEITPVISAEAGRHPAQFRITDSTTGGLLKSFRFHILLDESVDIESIVSNTSEFTALQDMELRVGDVSNVIENAETAINNANVATTSANSAATLANEKATLADTKATLADEKATLANTATTNANTAIANAITATNNANTATTNANNKAGLANTAATNANNVATQLETETLKIFKPAVSTYADLSTTYPTPENGWTVTVNGENPVVSYRYNGTEWVNLGVISSVDKATNTTLGVVRGGGNVNIDVNGVLSVPEIGDLSQLQTTSNTDLVGAVNELDLDKLEKNGDTKDNIATFEDYSSTTPPSAEIALGNIVTGNKLSSLFSNIKAFCKGVVTLGRLANNLSTTAEGLALDARQGKVLNDSISTINSNFDDHRSFIFSRTDASGLSAFPIDAGLYRVTIPNIPGLPSGINGYGCLVVFNCGDYRMLLYVDADFTLYSARADNANPVPTTWNKYTGATVQAQA